jgi:hypothetical protein
MKKIIEVFVPTTFKKDPLPSQVRKRRGSLNSALRNRRSNVTESNHWSRHLMHKMGTAPNQQYLRTVADTRFDIPDCNLIQHIPG